MGHRPQTSINIHSSFYFSASLSSCLAHGVPGKVEGSHLVAITEAQLWVPNLGLKNWYVLPVCGSQTVKPNTGCGFKWPRNRHEQRNSPQRRRSGPFPANFCADRGRRLTLWLPQADKSALRGQLVWGCLGDAGNARQEPFFFSYGPYLPRITAFFRNWPLGWPQAVSKCRKKHALWGKFKS